MHYAGEKIKRRKEKRKGSNIAKKGNPKKNICPRSWKKDSLGK
jgi:hypothetical protein